MTTEITKTPTEVVQVPKEPSKHRCFVSRGRGGCMVCISLISYETFGEVPELADSPNYFFSQLLSADLAATKANAANTKLGKVCIKPNSAPFSFKEVK